MSRLRRPGCRGGRAVPGSCRPAGKADGCGAPGVPGRGPYLRPARPRIRRAAVRGARLRTACPHQEPVLGPPSALASGRQAGPGPVHGVHQPGLGRAPAAAACAVPGCNYCHRGAACASCTISNGEGLPARHQRLAAGPGLRSALAAARCLRGPGLRPVGDAGHAVLPHPLPRAGGAAGPSPASSPRPAPIPAWGASGSTCAAFPAGCGWKSSTCCNAAGMSASRGSAPLGCSRSCGTWPPRELPRCWTGRKNNGRKPGRAASAPAAAASSPWTPASGSSSWPSAAAGKWNTRAASGDCATWASSPGREPPPSTSRRSASRGSPPWPSAGAGGGCQQG